MYLGTGYFGTCETCGATIRILPHHCDVLSEYDSAAEYMAQRGKQGKADDDLPAGLSAECHTMINDDPEAFEQRVKDTAYALAMSGRKQSVD